MPSRCSAGCHAPCSSAALRSGSSYVRHQALFIRSSFTHCTMLTALMWRCAGPQLQAHKSFLVCTITSPADTLFTWFHSLIRHYFISASCRPSAAFCSYARRQAIACVPGLHWHNGFAYVPCHIPPLHCAPIAAVTCCFTGRPRRWHSPSVSVHSSLIHSLGRLPARKTKYNISVRNNHEFLISNSFQPL
jgi:hypothetical protein